MLQQISQPLCFEVQNSVQFSVSLQVWVPLLLKKERKTVQSLAGFLQCYSTHQTKIFMFYKIFS